MSRSGILSAADEAHLERARLLARSGWGRVHPNPMVGCVLVRDGEVVGEGHHAEFGGPHAEVAAIEAARGRAEGATAYVTLEPCNHHGKTPPCTEALVRAGVRRVVFGASDPGSASGGGARTLGEAGIDVLGPLWDDATAVAENPAFFHAHRHGTPFVALKLALSLDGRIARAPGVRTHITGAEADRQVHRLRSGFDAILVGAGTARADDPRLTVRLTPPGRVPPRRIVLDPSAGLPSDAALFADAATAPVHVFARSDAREGELERLEAVGAHVHPVEGHGSDLDLHAVLRVCRGIGISSILCEGGARLAGSLLRQRLAGRLYLVVAPRALGDGALGAFGPHPEDLPWGEYRRATPPEAWGDDTLIVLDRKEI
jgi:diaminohydroxyphosphoribosylaminopyrimidine deaminase/5-amino-6-(5-phosphoribosylamino)uracil reductase